MFPHSIAVHRQCHQQRDTHATHQGRRIATVGRIRDDTDTRGDVQRGPGAVDRSGDAAQRFGRDRIGRRVGPATVIFADIARRQHRIDGFNGGDRRGCRLLEARGEVTRRSFAMSAAQRWRKPLHCISSMVERKSLA
ncbi:hypothetical protein LMG28614_03236 [Paraburkholderia ultramafica]|uniref:Uncharacterized protein n=1 Tax=Paraburkholderia ultramafica TaxID=1544867 RepID=A0A6S7CYB0_9BURK|nr:hypothetical protein [Paraburkholderia ultramafica]CAB3791154.1 hypothetical protein LMG28614_03236 [Paraburkholderia ultramafica]